MTLGIRVARNFASLGVGEVFARVATLIVGFYVARRFGPDEFGSLSFAIALTSFVYVIVDLGLTTVAVRDIARDRTLSGSYAVNVLALQLPAAVVLFAVVCVSTIWLPVSSQTKLLIVVLAFAVFPTAANIAYVMQAHEQMKLFAVARIAGQVTYVILALCLIVAFQNVVAVAIANVLSLVVAATAAVLLLHQRIKLRFGRVSFDRVRELAAAGAALLISGLAVQIYYNLDSVMLEFIKGPSSVGLYTSGYRLVQAAITLAVLLASAVFPIMAHAYGEDRFNQIVARWMRWNGRVSVPVVAFGIVAATPILHTIYGERYLAAAPSFRILLTTLLFIFVNVVLNTVLVVAHRQRAATSALVGEQSPMLHSTYS